MTPLKDKDLAGFRMPGPWPPAFVMDAPFYMHHLFPQLPFGPEDERYRELFKSQIKYMKNLSKASFDFFTEFELILNKPIHGKPLK
jgi:hypothetical protein